MTLLAATVTVGPASIAGAGAPEAAPVHEHAAAAIQLPTDLQKVTVKGEGFDACATPTTTQMTAFWTATPFFVNAVYIGGSVVACAPTITASWVSTVINQGWTLLPIWVGPQSPCTTFGGAKISTNTTTAYNQGYSEASAAYSKMVSLGMVGHSVVVYDMEGANNTAACTAAIDAFMSGWTTWLHLGTAQVTGVYTSACQGNINQFASVSPVVDFIWAAYWGDGPSINPIGCVNNGYWVGDQRHKQFQHDLGKTYNGVHMIIDVDCSDGPGEGFYDKGTMNCTTLSAN